jgi:hypothetical protein
VGAWAATLCTPMTTNIKEAVISRRTGFIKV